MHNNYHFLLHLADELTAYLSGAVVCEIFTQSKDELVLGFFGKSKKEHWLRSTLATGFTCLDTPTVFHRKKKNTVNLFEPLLDQSVLSCKVFTNDRSLIIHFSKDFALVFKLHYPKPNCLLLHKNEIIALFHTNFESDQNLNVKELSKSIAQTYENFLTQGFKNLFFTFDKNIQNALKQIGEFEKSPLEQWRCIQIVLEAMRKKQFFVYANDEMGQLTLFEDKEKELLYQSESALDTVHFFYKYALAQKHLITKKKQYRQQYQRRLTQTENYLNKSYRQLERWEDIDSYRYRGDVLMMNLQAIPENSSQVELQDWDNKTISIALKPNLSARENAARYYKRAKNQVIALQKLEEGIDQKEKQRVFWKDCLTELENIRDVNSLRKYTKKRKQFIEPKNKLSGQTAAQPFHEFTHLNYKIYVGKSAQSNELLLKFAKKEDLWLHVRDATGAHVIIRSENTNPFPQAVIEKAAQLAAHYSKRKSESICPVMFTKKKYVRKPRGAVAGQVLCTHEQTIWISSQD